MSTTVPVTQAAPAVATPASSCVSKVSKAVTIVGAVLATAVALAEGSRFLDLSANIFQHLPSMETNIAIGVAGVTAMIAGQVLGCLPPQKVAALKEVEGEVKVAGNKEIEKAQFLRIKEMLIEGFDKALDRIKEIQKHPQSRADEENRQLENADPLARQIIKALKDQQGFTSGPLFSQADTKLNFLLQQIRFALFSRPLDEISKDSTISKLVQLTSEVEALIDHRLLCLDNRAEELKNQEVDGYVTDFEKTFDEIISKVNPSIPYEIDQMTIPNAIEQMDKILKEVAAVIEGEISSDGEDFLNNNNNQGEQ